MIEKLTYSTKVELSDSELEDLLVFAGRTAKLAGVATLEYFRGDLGLENKRGDGGFDPVTAADKAAEEVIRREIEREYPEHGIYGEEFGMKPGNGLTWVIDPIDGTRAFMTGMVHWGVLIGLFDGQDAVVGVMYQPYTDELFTGTSARAMHSRGGESRVLVGCACDNLAEAVLGTTGPHWFVGDDQQAFQHMQSSVRMTRFGGDCYLFGMVAMGYLHLGMDGSLNPYDIMALIPIIRGAGGEITTLDGGNPCLGGAVIAAGNPRLHAAALRVIGQ